MPINIEVNRNLLEMEYAVRGPIPQKALQMKRDGRKIIFCNIGNPQSLGQHPLSFYRQVLSLLENPAAIPRERSLLKIAGAPEFISDYVLDLTEQILKKMETGMGAYTESKGPLFIRQAIAAYIDKRDKHDNLEFRPADPDSIYITNGASDGAKNVLEAIISNPKDGIMIPIPQYPLYSAAIRKNGGVQVNYYPDEDNDWALSGKELERSLAKAKKDGVKVKCIVVINPGNPTGAILDEKSMREVVDLAEQHGLAILADEVYQENTYGIPFVSFARLVGKRDIPLFSLHSVSKGFYGECGHRGGYLEVRNAPGIVGSDKILTDILLKQASVSLCSNTVGQVLTYLLVNPPPAGSTIFAQFEKEKKTVLNDLYAKATIMKEAFKKMDGVECFGRIGAMYLFPRLNKLPSGTTDFDYCMKLLEETGMCVVNGSGFGQKEGTSHFRVAFLPPRDMLEQVLPAWIKFHNKYVNR